MNKKIRRERKPKKFSKFEQNKKDNCETYFYYTISSNNIIELNNRNEKVHKAQHNFSEAFLSNNLYVLATHFIKYLVN